MHPADYVRRREAPQGKSDQKPAAVDKQPLLPNQSRGSAEEFRTKVESFVGKTLQTHLPLQIGGVTLDYVFTFKINNVHVSDEPRREEKAKNLEGGKKGGGGGRGKRF